MKISIEDLKYLSGTWEGNGVAAFPSIDTFNYSEELVCSFNEKNPVMHYEQKDWLTSNGRNGEPISWESGFLIDKGDNQFELICTHNTGRIERYLGLAERLSDEKIKIEFVSELITNDDRVQRSKRTFVFTPSEISYEQSMDTPKVAKIEPHLKAVLLRP